MANQNFRVKNGLEVGVGGTILYAKDNGNIGVGTDNPTDKLYVYSSNGNTISTIDSVGNDAGLQLKNSGDGNWSGINFIRERSTGTNVTGGSIWMPSVTANNSALLYIQTQSASAQSGVDSALVDNNGVRLKLASQPNGVAADTAFSVEVGSQERFRINSSGNIGIGTDNPGTELHVQGNNGYAELRLSGQSGSGATIEFYDATTKLSDFYTDTSSNIIFRNTASNTERLRITSGGNAVFSGGANPTIDITGTSGSAIIKSSDRDLNYDARYGTHVFKNNGSEQVRINSSGNLGIATDSPSQKLDVNGGARFRGAIYDNNNAVGAANSVLSSTGSGVQWVSVSAGSDADTLDGLDSSQFLRSDTDDDAQGFGSRANVNTTGDPGLLITNGGRLGFDQSGTRSWTIKATGGNLAIASGDGSGSLTYNSNTVWHSGNHGSGSGLDADFLDGISSASFLRSDAGDTFTGTVLSIESTTDGKLALKCPSGDTSDWNYIEYYGTNGTRDGYVGTNASGILRVVQDSGSALEMSTTSGLAYLNSNKIWTAGNDGSGSGLDADTLDGINSASFLRSDAADIATGPISWTGTLATFDPGGSPGTDTATDVALALASGHRLAGHDNGYIRTLLEWNTGSDIEIGQGGTSLIAGINLLPGSTGVAKVNGNTIWHGGNDGSGSGLDADLLDGINSGSFLRSDADDSTSGYLQAEGFVGSGGSLRIANPGGASFATNASATTGYLKVTLPVSWTNTMMRMTIKCYEYQTGESFDIHCGGYNYAPSTSWINTFAYITGGNSLSRNFNVRFGHDGSKCAIYIGESNSGWSYFQFGVTDFLAGYSNYSASTWHNGWSCSITTSLGTITATLSSNQLNKYVDGNTVWHAGNDGSGSGLDADTVDGIQGASFLRSDADDTWSSVISTTSTNGIRFGSANETDGNDGYIAAGRFGSGLNIVGTQTQSGTGRQIRIWGSVITDGGNSYWHAGNDGSGSGLDADLWDGNQFSSYLNQAVLTSSSPYFDKLSLFGTSYIGGMQSGSLSLGNTSNNYKYTSGWSSSMQGGILASCADNWEFVIHDSGDALASPFCYNGGSSGRHFEIGRDLGWGTMYTILHSSARSPIFYDSDNTGYYTNPASTSILNVSRHNGIIAGTTSDLSSRGQIGVYSSSSPYISFHDNTTSRTAYFQEASGRFYCGEVSYTESEGSFRAPVFYDSNNTGYYTDPASTSRMNRIDITMLYSPFSGANSGLTRSSYPYGFGFQESGAWSSPYPDLVLQYHTGVTMAANPSYNGITFKYDHNNDTVVFRVNGGSSYMYKYYWMYTNTSGYYSDTNNWHIEPNGQTSYGSMNVRGSRNNWYGISWHEPSNDPHIMWDNSGGGLYAEGLSRWMVYHSYGNNCLGVNGSTTSSTYELYVSGDIYATGTITAASDVRLKKNIETIESPLDKVLKLRGVTFEWDLEKKKNRKEGTKMGLIAQEVVEVVPEVVTYAEDVDEYSVEYGNLTALLIEAVKEQNEIINTMRQEINDLKSKLGE